MGGERNRSAGAVDMGSTFCLRRDSDKVNWPQTKREWPRPQCELAANQERVA